VLLFCNDSDKHSGFLKRFIGNDILQKGISMIKVLKEQNPKNVEGMFNSEKAAIDNVNPYLLRSVTSFMVKNSIKILEKIPNGFSSLLNIHCFMVLYFQENKSLVTKLLRSSLKLIDYARSNSKSLSESGEIKEIVQSQIVKFVTG
jgi:hypothetical protein